MSQQGKATRHLGKDENIKDDGFMIIADLHMLFSQRG